MHVEDGFRLEVLSRDVAAQGEDDAAPVLVGVLADVASQPTKGLTD